MLTVAYSWLLPPVKTGVTNAILGNWQLSGISSWVSGAPLQLINGTGGTAGNLNLGGTNKDGVDDQQPRTSTARLKSPVMPVLTCDPRGSGDTPIIANCFAAPAAGQLGNYIWPNITGPSYMNHDLSAFKNFPINGNRKFQFRLSAYNVFNHPQRTFDDPTNLTLHFTNGVMDERELRRAAAGQQVRPPHRPDGVQVLLLGQRPWDGRAEALRYTRIVIAATRSHVAQGFSLPGYSRAFTVTPGFFFCARRTIPMMSARVTGALVLGWWLASAVGRCARRRLR